MLREIDQIAVGIGNTILRLSIRRSLLNLGCRPQILTDRSQLLDVVDLDAEVIEAFFVVAALFDKRNIQVAVG